MEGGERGEEVKPRALLQDRMSFSANLLFSCPADEQDQLEGGEADLSLVTYADLSTASCRPGFLPLPEAREDVLVKDAKAVHTPAHPQEQESVRPPVEKGTLRHFTRGRERFQ